MKLEDARQEAFRSDLKQIQQNIEVNEAMASQGNDLATKGRWIHHAFARGRIKGIED